MKDQLLKLSLILLVIPVIYSGCAQKREVSIQTIGVADTIYSNYSGKGIEIIIDFQKGKSHNHPSFVFWIEDLEGNYIQTLFVTKSVATGIFGYADGGKGTWKNESGVAVRPAALPYWSHKSNLQSVKSNTDFIDAYSGATPKSNFVVKSKSDIHPNQKFRLLMEINQPWDWNEYWTNNKYPDNSNYKNSCQPSLVYAVDIDLNRPGNEYFMNPIGHGHFAGEDGNLYTDLTTFTTALKIATKINISLK